VQQLNSQHNNSQQDYENQVSYEVLGRLTVEYNAMIHDLHRLAWRTIPVEPDTGVLLTGNYDFKELLEFLKKLADARHIGGPIREELLAISSLASSTGRRREQIMRSLYWADESVGYLAPHSARPLRLKTIVDTVQITGDVVESFISECKQVRSFVWRLLVRISTVANRVVNLSGMADDAAAA